jgi:hypothetical protein
METLSYLYCTLGITTETAIIALTVVTSAAFELRYLNASFLTTLLRQPRQLQL